jgi:hypothetical protein
MCAVPNMAVVCSSLISCFPDMLLRYCLSDYVMVPVAHIISGILLLLLFLAAGRPGERQLHNIQGSHPVSAVQPPTQNSDFYYK